MRLEAKVVNVATASSVKYTKDIPPGLYLSSEGNYYAVDKHGAANQITTGAGVSFAGVSFLADLRTVSLTRLPDDTKIVITAQNGKMAMSHEGPDDEKWVDYEDEQVPAGLYIDRNGNVVISDGDNVIDTGSEFTTELKRLSPNQTVTLSQK